MAAGLVALLAAVKPGLFELTYTLPLEGLAAAAASFAGLRLVSRLERMHVKDAESVLVDDPRAPVVYLRPFQADRQLLSFSPWRSRTPMRSVSLEGWLARTLRDIGPLVAIGDPAERLPVAGAARLYASDDQWRARLDDLIIRGGLIILQTGASPGLAWETAYILGLGQPGRLILCLPPAGRAERERQYAGFRERVGHMFPHGLPEGAGDTYVMYFDADWLPRRLEEQGVPAPGTESDLRALALSKLAPSLRLMWAPRWARAALYCCSVLGLTIVYAVWSMPDG